MILTLQIAMSDKHTINLALCCLNLAEAGYSVIDKYLLCEIYATVAVTVQNQLKNQKNPISVCITEHFINSFIV